eukprot:1659865-Alexandrium_andersonii.AAC.1
MLDSLHKRGFREFALANWAAKGHWQNVLRPVVGNGPIPLTEAARHATVYSYGDNMLHPNVEREREISM